jgi:hypothetical protein
MRPGGCAGLIATDSIAQGETRLMALQPLLDEGIGIFRAVRYARWPGSAKTNISKLWLTKGPWAGEFSLEGLPVPGITASLEGAAIADREPHRLAENEEECLIGSYANGAGFILTAVEARSVLDANPSLAAYLRPYLNGQDLNGQPPGAPVQRWAIFFGALELSVAERVAPELMHILRERVYPSRQAIAAKKPKVARLWWQFEYPAQRLYARLAGRQRAVVLARITTYPLPQIVDLTDDPLFNEKTLVVVTDDDLTVLGLLSSTFHQSWVARWAVTLGARRDPTYSPRTCYETFPKPRFDVVRETLRGQARELASARLAAMARRDLGLTGLYNLVHDNRVSDDDVVAVRNRHVDVDRTMAIAYGWHDLDVARAFFPTPVGLRYTVGGEVEREILDRLLELNHTRYAREQAGAATGAKPVRKRARSVPGQVSMLGDD